MKHSTSGRPPTVRVWDDLDAYKKIFVIQGFYELAHAGEVTFELVPYDYFEKGGAPAPVGSPYQSHRNIVVFEIQFADRKVRAAYDSNDLYYKIPNALLRWADVYFKSNYQAEYLRTGELLRGPFWAALTFRPECLPERLDAEHSKKVVPCSFTMRLFPDLRRNRRYIAAWQGRWLKVPWRRKGQRLFYLGRWWGEGRPEIELRSTELLFLEVRRLGLEVLGGIVASAEALPALCRPFAHESVALEEWLRMCCRSQVSVMTRGLDGCMSFKALNYLMVGSPFIALAFRTNFWQPIAPPVNYLEVADDFSDLGQQLSRCTPEMLREMGERNLEHWRRYVSPEATGRHILAQARRFLERRDGA